MALALSADWRRRVVAAVEDGMSCRATAARFGVAPLPSGGVPSRNRIGRFLTPDRRDRHFNQASWGCGDPTAPQGMARRHGRAAKGERCRAPVPHGHWKTTTFVGALRHDRMTAPLALDGPMNGSAFQAHVGQVLLPTLQTG